MKSVFQQYYDLEKNFEINCFWNGGFNIHFGDYVNGFEDKIYTCSTWEEVEEVFKKKLKDL